MKLSDQINTAELLRLSQAQADPDARAVYARLLLWAPGQTLQACFISGTAQEKQFFVAAAQDLLRLSQTNIKVDFGVSPDYRPCAKEKPWADVRVSFTDDCCSAYIGRLAHHENATFASVEVRGLLAYPPEKARQIATHEFMHVLGFEHEHQGPDATCEDEFNKRRIMVKTGWGEKDYRTNLGRLDRDSRSYKWTSYDNNSIMKYFFEADEFKNGTNSVCYSGENYVPSPTDLEGLRDAYPTKPVVAASQARAVLSGIGATDASPALKAFIKTLQKRDSGN